LVGGPLGDLAGDVLRGQPQAHQHLRAGALRVEPLGHTEITQRDLHVGIPQRGRERPPEPAVPAAVLDGDHQAVPGGEVHQLGRDRHHPARVDHGHPDPLVGQPVRGGQPQLGERADGDQQDIGALPRPRPAQHVHRAEPLQRRHVLADGGLGEAQHRGTVVDANRLAQLLAQRVGIARRRDADARHRAKDRQVPHAVVAGAVRTGDAGPVEHQGDREPVQRDVHQHLVEGPVEECRVDRHDRVQPGHRHAGGGGHRMLLGDADVEAPVGVRLGERAETGGAQHRRRDRHDVRPLVADARELVGEHRGPGGALGPGGLAGDRVDRVGLVHLVDFVVLREREAAALAGDRVHDDRSAEVLGTTQRAVQGGVVVAVHRAQVLQPEILEHHLRAQRVLDRAFRRVQRRVHRLADDRGALQHPLAARQRLLVAGPGPQRGQVIGEAADGRRVGPPVVVDHDHHRAVLAGGDVVQRLPAHAPGERAVADDRDHVPPLGPQLERLGQAVRIGQCGGGVAVLDEVVLALGAARVARDAVPLAQAVELVAPAGDDLVHVGLVAHVEDDGVAGRVEGTVDRDGELDHAEVGSKVAAGPGHPVHQELADLDGKPLQLLMRQPFQIGRPAHGLKQRHRFHLTLSSTGWSPAWTPGSRRVPAQPSLRARPGGHREVSTTSTKRAQDLPTKIPTRQCAGPPTGRVGAPRQGREGRGR
jgi:hypothetical protein